MGLLPDKPHDARAAVSSMPPHHYAQPAGECRPLNIVHITASLSPHVGGPATVAMHLAAVQASLGHDVSILSGLHKRNEAALESAAAGVRDFSRVKVHLDRRPMGWRGVLRNRRPIAAADVVHLHGIWSRCCSPPVCKPASAAFLILCGPAACSIPGASGSAP